jgi:hypothetical protein
MRIALVCLFAFFVVKQRLYAQTTTGRLLWQAKEIKLAPTAGKKDVKIFNAVARPAIHPNSIRSIPAFPCNYYSTTLGWVCTQEWKLEKKTAVPFRFRLGSKEQVDWLEGKDYRHP